MSPLINESVFPLSVRVNHPPTQVSLRFQNSQFVSGTFLNLRHHQLHLQLFKVVLLLLLTHRRKKESVISLRGVTHPLVMFYVGWKVANGKIPHVYHLWVCFNVIGQLNTVLVVNRLHGRTVDANISLSSLNLCLITLNNVLVGERHQCLFAFGAKLD